MTLIEDLLLIFYRTMYFVHPVKYIRVSKVQEIMMNKKKRIKKLIRFEMERRNKADRCQNDRNGRDN